MYLNEDKITFSREFSTSGFMFVKFMANLATEAKIRTKSTK